MLKLLSFAYLLLVTLTLNAASVFTTPAKKMEGSDVAIINQFCVKYKNNMIESFNMVTSENVSKETFVAFGMLVHDKIRPANLEFFSALKEMGADKCQF